MFRTVPAYHHELFTVHIAMLYSRIRTELHFRTDSARKMSANLHDIYHWCVYSEKQRNCPKHVEFYSKNKFEKLVHLVGFIIRIYHDARSRERQLRSRMCAWDKWHHPYFSRVKLTTKRLILTHNPQQITFRILSINEQHPITTNLNQL